MPVPTTKVVLQRFVGMVNYLGKFIPNLSDETAPLRALLRNETEFLMQKPQLDSFEKLKRLISLVPSCNFLTQTYQNVFGQTRAQLVCKIMTSNLTTLLEKP